ncbi:hypothetical protein DSO57_1016390 [Entomophthora muscae]|uniref:Uncharacterized protein n=1 Tax=Entomophthora muscae TaxID=34485 RepID=A0ACC2S6U4_9FUNG|nr:hypothetical protein DSO57_1016390 [Entomophthora muscae]
MQQSFLFGKSILLTGVTGFVGKAVLESILRDHHRHIKHVFCLVRANDKQSMYERIKQVLDGQLFDALRNRVGVVTFKDIAAKVVPIQGDISIPGVGLSEGDIGLLHAHLNLVIHSAATVNFNMPLKDALRINTLGTMELLDICERGAHFQGFVYISTAYVNANLKSGKVEERLYAMPLGDPATLVNEIQAKSTEQAIRFTKKVLQVYPNTYTFTKSITEHLLYNCATPTASVRLNVVASSAQDPVPGWVDGTSGLNGASILIGQGIIDTLHIPRNKSPDIVPVDFATNAITRICAEMLDTPATKSTTSAPPPSTP